MELPALAKKMIVDEQINEALKIKFRAEIEIRKAAKALKDLKALKTNIAGVATAIESQENSMVEHKNKIEQMDIILDLMVEMKNEIEKEIASSTPKR